MIHENFVLLIRVGIPAPGKLDEGRDGAKNNRLDLLNAAEVISSPMDVSGIQISSTLATASAAAGGVYAVFLFIDNGQTEENRRATHGWLTGICKQYNFWDSFFIDLFRRTFGSSHWSWKCLIRSISLSVILVCACLLRFVSVGNISFWGEFHNTLDFADLLGPLSAPFFMTVFTNYVSLWKTRVILTRFTSISRLVGFVGVIIIDLAITAFLCLITLFLILLYVAIANYVRSSGNDFGEGFGIFWNGLSNGKLLDVMLDLNVVERGVNLISHRSSFEPTRFGPIEYSIVFSFGGFNNHGISFEGELLYGIILLTSAWLWVYIVGSYLIRALSFLPPVLLGLAPFIDVAGHPVRSAGYVASALTAVVVAFWSVL